MKQTIKLRETELKRVIAESVKRVLKESGDTKRGSYLMGRAGKRNLIRGDISNFIDKRDKASNKDAFNQGMEDQTAYGINLKDPSRDSTWDMRNNRRLKFNYNTYKTEDMDELGRKFIDFIEKYDGGVLMDTVVDYESGNQTGKKESPLKEIIPYFEEEVLGYDCTPDMIDAIKRAYNQWWFYAEDQLMPYDEDEEVVYESIRGTLKEGRKDITPDHEFKLRKYVGKLAKQVKHIWKECTMYDQGMNNYLADLVQNEPWVDKLWDVANEMEEYAETIDKKTR